MAKKKTTKKMAYGGNIEDILSQYFNNIQSPTKITDPNETLAKNDIMKARAMQNSSNWLTAGLDTLGGLGLEAGLGVLNTGLQELPKKAFGGKTGTAVEVEGGEVGELPNGGLIGFEGPSHAGGGIDVNLPGGTEIFSDRIKIDGVSMADRKKKRGKKENTLEKLFGKNPTDALIKNALDRTRAVNQAEDSFDSNLQEGVNSLLNPDKLKFPTGGIVPKTGGLDPRINPLYFQGEEVMGDMGMMSLMPQDNLFLSPGTSQPIQNATEDVETTNSKGGVGSLFKNMALPTGGDVLGILGNLHQGFSGKTNTLANRAGDTPNINHFADFGKKGLETLDGAKNSLQEILSMNEKALTEAKLAAQKTNTRTARGINTQRALNLASEANTNRALESLYSNYAQQMLGLTGQQANLETQQDQMVMQGNSAADLANRQDRDAFFTQLGVDEKSIGQAISKLGGNLNQILGRGANSKMLNQLSDFFDYNPMTGEFTPKKDIELTTKTKKK